MSILNQPENSVRYVIVAIAIQVVAGANRKIINFHVFFSSIPCSRSSNVRVSENFTIEVSGVFSVT